METPNEQDAHDSASLLIDDAKIMMVDDEPLNMDVLEIHLGAEGYKKFVAVSDSTKAMERLRQELPDVLLLDLVMPEVTGFGLDPATTIYGIFLRPILGTFTFGAYPKLRIG